MYRYICLRLIGIAVFICISCVHHQNFSLYEDRLVAYMWSNHKKLISHILNYQAHGTAIIHIINNQRKMYVPFVWVQDNNDCSVKLFNVFGLTIISISMENGVVSILNNISRQNNDLYNEIQKWFIDINYFLEQLQQWLIGLPDSNVEYHLNSIGCLSHINYYYKNKNISIYYRHYHTNSTPILPKVIDVYCGQYYIKLIINYWNI